MDRAACKNLAPHRGDDGSLEPDLFFPERGEPTDPGKRICISCPVRKPCKKYRDRTQSTEGMWGGEILKKDGK